MLLYHGSNVGNIKILEPNQADHDRPYVYMTTIDVVAAFYLCNAVERPYYWFPYGFERDSEIPVYHELYPNALKEVSEGVSGYIYEIFAEEKQVCLHRRILKGKEYGRDTGLLLCPLYKRKTAAGMGKIYVANVKFFLKCHDSVTFQSEKTFAP